MSLRGEIEEDRCADSGADFGAWSSVANQAIDDLLVALETDIQSGALGSGDEVMDAFVGGMQAIAAQNPGQGVTDTCVKEGAWLCLQRMLEERGMEFDQMNLYGW